MNKSLLTFLTLGGILIVIVGSIWWWYQRLPEPQTAVLNSNRTTTTPTVETPTPTATSELISPATSTTYGHYEDFSSDKLTLAKNGKIVLFFYAAWCPTCNGLQNDINAHLKNIPSDVTILRVNYDHDLDLVRKYKVTYQHTLVQVNEHGKELAKWAGSPTLNQLLKKII